MEDIEDVLLQVRQTLIDSRNVLVNKPFIRFRLISLFRLKQIDRLLDVIDKHIRLCRVNRNNTK